MSFDLSWFTTVPGLLITGGIILLIIAVVIMLIDCLLITNLKRNHIYL